MSDSSPASNRDDWSHPSGPYHANHSGVPTLEKKWVLLSETADVRFLDTCSHCRVVRGAAKARVEYLGHESYVHISLSKDGHIFAFRSLRRASVRRLAKHASLPVPPFAHGKLPRDGKRTKVYVSFTDRELALIDEDMKKHGGKTRASTIRGILFQYFRGDLAKPEPSDIDFAHLLRPRDSPDALKSEIIPEYPTAVVPVVSRLSVSSSAVETSGNGE